jgi:hypothetical protein
VPRLKLLLVVLVGLNGLLLGWGATTAVSWPFLLLLIISTGGWLLWLAADGQRWPGAPDGLAALLGLAGAWALWQAHPGGLPAYLGLIGLLLAWDGSLLYSRLAQPDTHVVAANGLIWGRNGRLLALAFLSLLALPLVGWLPLSFQFDWALLLALALLFSLRYLAGVSR